MKVHEGNGGWFEVLDPSLGLPGRLYLRLEKVNGSRRITELYVDGQGDAIRPGALGRLQLGSLEEWLGMCASETRAGVAGPDLSRLASYFATTWGDYKGRHCGNCEAPLQGAATRPKDRAITDWTELAWLSQYDKVDIDQPPMKKRPKDKLVAPVPELDLEYNPEAGLSNAFLADVARNYEIAIARGLAPAVAIAERARVQKKTAQSWIYKARLRGLMPPAKSKGRVV